MLAYRHALAEASIGSFDQYRAVLDVGGPVTGTTGVRMVAVREDNGSFRDFAGNDRLLLAPSIGFAPTERLRLLYQLEYSEYDSVFDRGVVSVDGNGRALARERFLGEPNDGEVEQRSEQHQASLIYDLTEGVALEGGVQYRTGSIQGFLSEPNFANALSPPSASAPGARILQRTYRQRVYDFDDLSARLELSANGRLFGLAHQFRVGVDALDYRQRQINDASNGQNYGTTFSTRSMDGPSRS
jgi:iron complex outermembrane receptor protein